MNHKSRAMKLGLIGGVSVLLAVFCGACSRPCLQGDGARLTESHQTGEFSQLMVDGPFDVEIIIDGKRTIAGGKLTIDAPSNLVPLVKAEVENNSMNISPRGCFTSEAPVRIMVAGNHLEQLTCSGSGNVLSNRGIAAGNMVILVTGSGNVDLKLKCGSAEIRHEGSGQLSLNGFIDSLTLVSAGSGAILADMLKSEHAVIKCSGSGATECWAEGSLDVVLTGSGDLSVRGRAKLLRSEITGSGKFFRNSLFIEP